MATSSESRFRAAVRNHEAKAVPMNGFDSVVFSQTPCIGTDGLGSCSVVLIVSPQAAILGHVSPRPDGNNISDPNAGDNHVRDFIDRLIEYYRQYQKFFPGSPHSWVVYAIFGAGIALPDQQSIMREKLRGVGLNVETSETYRVPYTADHLNRGSFFVDARSSTIQVYVEDRVVRSISKVTASSSYATAHSTTTASPSYATSYATAHSTTTASSYTAAHSTTTASPSSGSAPAETRWDGQYYVSIRNPAYVWINGAWISRP